MAFSISEVYALEYDRCHAILQHHGQLLTVILRCGLAEALRLPPEFTAELDYTSVVKFEADLPPDDTQSGIFPTDDPAVILADGRVHNHVEIGPDHVLIAVCTQTGPSFFTFTSEQLADTVPSIDTRLRVWLLGLSVYPVHT